MTDKTERIILPDDAEAATYRTDIKGWVSRTGMFFGDGEHNERTARWNGATHTKCTQCGEPSIKSYTLCYSCRNKKDIAKWEAMPRAPYDGGWLYSQALDRWFRDEEELHDFLCNQADAYEYIDDLLLVMCKPVYPYEIEPNEYYSDDLSDEGDGSVDGGLQDAFDTLNAYIREHRVALSYAPVDVVPVFTDQETV